MKTWAQCAGSRNKHKGDKGIKETSERMQHTE